MEKYRKIAKITLFLTAITVSIIFIIDKFDLIYQNKNSGEKISQISKEASLSIDFGTENPLNFNVKIEEEISAFELLKKITEENNINLIYKNYDIGVFVEKIREKNNGENGNYWLYYVNGEAPQVAADKYNLKAGDKLEFKFEKSPF